MAYWLDPNPMPGPAFEQAKFQLHAAPIGHVLAAILHDREQQQAQIQQQSQQALSGLAGYMKDRRTDQIAQTLLDQASYPDQGQGDPTAIALNESAARPGDAWAAYQQQRQANLKQSLESAQLEREQALTKATNAGATRVPVWLPDGTQTQVTPDAATQYYYGQGNRGEQGVPIYAPDGSQINVSPHDAMQYWYGGGGSQQPDDWSKAIAVARGSGTGEDFEGDPNGPNVKLQLPNGKAVVMPWSSYQGHMNPGKPTLPTNPGTPTGPGVVPPGSVAGPNSGAVTVVTQQQYDALPSGATYQAPDGTIRRKP